jgi:integrase
MAPKRARRLTRADLLGPRATRQIAAANSPGPSTTRKRRLLRSDLDGSAAPLLAKRPKLPANQRELAQLTATRATTTGTTADESSSTSSSGGDGVEAKTRAQNLLRRGESRRRRYLTAAMEGVGTGQSFLEARSVRQATRERYLATLRRFNTFATSKGRAVQGAEETDAALVEWFEDCFFKGEMPSTGETALAALMHIMPAYGRHGAAKLPRAWRALQGWRLLSPVRTRRPVPWPVWAALAWRLVEAKQLRAAVFLLLLVSTYLRPSELLRARAEDLSAPAASVVQHWSLLIAPEQRGLATKTGVFSDSVLLDCPYTAFLAPMVAQLARQPKGTPLWDFSYPEFAAPLKTAAAELGVTVHAYQARHSGPSIDLAKGLRTLEAAQKRGRWASPKSVIRYERHARLAAEWSKLTAAQQAVFLECERRVEDIFFGRPTGIDLPAGMAFSRGATSRTSSRAPAASRRKS